MEAHATLIESEYLERMPKVVSISIEQTIPEPGANDDADDDAANDCQ